MKIHIIILFILSHASGGFVENTEFDVKIEKMVREKAGGNPSFLRKFVNKNGIPQGLKKSDFNNSAFCFNITDDVLIEEKYAECTILEAKNKSVLKLDKFTEPFKVFKFTVNLRELKNVDLEMTHQQHLTYFYFSSFRKCENCIFNFTKNPSLVGLRFWHLSHEANLTEIPKNHRPKLYIRGNRQLKLSLGEDRRKINDLRKICNPELCEIQKNEECHFRYSIKKSSEYRNCRYVYGDMIFTSRFQENSPDEMIFKIDGCFVFNRTGIQFVRPMLRAFPNCTKEHIFEHNKYMCTDQIDQLKKHWVGNKINVISDNKTVNCYQGECRGGYLSESKKDRFAGCETAKGDVYISEKSGNLSEVISDLSYFHFIHGQFQLVNNPSVTDLYMPFLKEITSDKCPALVISNMTNLENIIFHAQLKYTCKENKTAVLIMNSPKLYLHKQVLRQMKRAGASFDMDMEKDDSFSGNYTFLLIVASFVIVIFVEIVWALRRNLLLPNFMYRLFPMSLNRRPKQKKTKTKKNKVE